MRKGSSKKEKSSPAPKTIIIVAMGASASTYVNLASHKGGRQRITDETWAINSMGGVIKHDLLFHMDDCRVHESMAKRDPDGNIAGMMEWLKDHPKFMTSKKYPDYPGAIEFPLEKVINYLGTTYYNSTVAYAVAYAIYIGVQKIGLYGCDYSYKDQHKAESGRGCVEFLLGMAVSRGIHIEVAENSTLFDACVPDSQRFYGYDASDVTLEQTDKGIKVNLKQRDKLPSAEEMEVRYCHEPKT